MPKEYMLTHLFKKPCNMIGERIVERPGNCPNGVEFVYIPFVPGKSRPIPEGLDVSKAVKAGFLKERVAPAYCEPEKVEETVSKEETVTADVGVMKVEISAGEDGEFGTEDDSTEITRKVDSVQEDDSKEETKEEDSLELGPDEEPVKGVHYKKLSKDSFQCLICNRKTKKEESMKSHVLKYHVSD